MACRLTKEEVKWPHSPDTPWDQCSQGWILGGKGRENSTREQLSAN